MYYNLETLDQKGLSGQKNQFFPIAGNHISHLDTCQSLPPSSERLVQSLPLKITDLLIYRLKLFIAKLYLLVLLPNYFSA